MHEITAAAITPADFSRIRCIRGFETIQRDYPAYLTDESKFMSHEAGYLFFPENEAELSAILQEMGKSRTAVTISAARTGLVGGCVPSDGAIVSLERFNSIRGIHYDCSAREWRLWVECNVLLRDLNRKAIAKSFPEFEKGADRTVKASYGKYRNDPRTYFYPPDPTETSASLGGTVATNASGARSYRYNATRNWVRRIRVMLANGEVLDIPRGKVFASFEGDFTVYDSKGNERVINIPDYTMPKTKCTSGLFSAPNMDLIDLFIGSEGILGIITMIEVALLEKQDKISIVQFLNSDQTALDFVIKLREDKRIRPDFIEFYSCRALDLLRSRQLIDAKSVGMPLIPPGPVCAVFFELSFDPDDAQPDFSALETVAGQCGALIENSWAGYEPREMERFKVFRHILPEAINGIIAERKKEIPQLHKLGTDLAVPNPQLQTIWDFYEDSLESAGLEWVAFGHIGNNHIHINILPRSLEELQKGLALYEDFARKAVFLGGAVSAEHGIGKIKKKFLRLMYSDDLLEQIKRVKAALDPGFMLNPGNMIDV
ncbi:MAG: FAD-binding oxidoreductase [Desulfobacterales bacterium]|nr:FAD-binding oxidoreductase [Desulfobacterales bacterium]